jgi:subtilisin family serine protease
MRVLHRAIVTSITSLALAASWLAAAPGAAAAPAEPAARHIVVLHDDADSDAVARDHGRRHGAQVEHVYRHALKGYVAVLKGNAAKDVARDPRVDFVELDRPVSVHSLQPNAPWGLDRIDQRNLPLSTGFTYAADGTGVTAYIIDTGIQYNHSEFAGNRAVKGADFVPGGKTGADCDGHGTHVAGTVGGSTYGVAKKVRLVSVRVLDCKGSGSWSGVIKGIDFVTGDHDPGERAVANMSLGGGVSDAVDAAVRRSIADGVTYVVAAGNGDSAGVAQDACSSSPARVGEAITIGATDKADKKSSWSNFGSCVDFFAPGVDILSARYSKTSTNGSTLMSGTSMAAPHTAGVVALYLSGPTGTPIPTPTAIQGALAAATTKNVIGSANLQGSPNALLFTSF